MTESDGKILKVIKILGIVNLLSIVILWMPIASHYSFDSRPEEMFAALDSEVRAIFFLCVLYSLQGLLAFIRELRKWDLVTSGVIFLLSIYFWLSFDEPPFLIAIAPMAIYFLLQIKRDRTSDNFKVAYLNVWNLALVIITLVMLGLH